ncbi:MAG: adenylate/guanylate cyclase domain-containing protein [Geminicoccaceae bacterium]
MAAESPTTANAAAPPAEPAKGRSRLRFSLSFLLVALSVLTVACTAAAVHFSWLVVSRQNVATLVEQLNIEVVAGVDREIGSIFDSAVAAQTTIRDALRDHVIDIDDKTQREGLFFAILNANPHFSWVSFGKPDGDFFGAQRRDDTNLRLVESRWDTEKRQARRTEVNFVKEGNTISRMTTRFKVNDYYAPLRDWYVAAVDQPNTNIWTDIYIFSDSHLPGLNSAITTYTPPGLRPAGVISIAIELERLSRYLADLPALQSGAAFIVDRDGRLIAFGDPTEVGGPDENAAESLTQLRPLAAAKDPLLRLASDAIAGSGMMLPQIARPLQMTHPGPGGDYFVTLAPARHRGWLVGTVMPEREFVTAIEQSYLRLAAAVAGVVVVFGLLMFLLARHLFIGPIRRLIARTGRIARFDLDAPAPPPSPLVEVQAIAGAVDQMSRSLGSFRRYLPADLVQTLMEQGVVAQLGGERRMLSVMFMDLEGFTATSERYGHRVVPLLAEYFGAMSAVIQRHHGTIDKFIGDAIMAFWGAPKFNEEHPSDVCRAAVECLQRMRELQDDWEKRGLPRMQIRIGINTGRMVVGNIGSPDRLNYTVIGDPVNLAARIEGMNKIFATAVLISQHTYELAKYEIVARRLDEVTARGRTEPVSIYELLGLRDERGEATGFEWVKLFEAARALYDERRWLEAIEQFRAVIQLRGADPASELYIRRCEEKMAAEPRTLVLAKGRDQAS